MHRAGRFRAGTSTGILGRMTTDVHVRRACSRAALVGLLVAAHAAGAGGLPARAFDYALFGFDDVTLGSGAQVDAGDVGCNLPLGRVWLQQRARVAGAVAGDTVRLGRNARAGGVWCRVLEGATSPACGAVTLPLLADLPLVQVVPGGVDVKLPRKSLQSGLPSGAYRRIVVGSRSRLSLAGGTYAVSSLEVRRNGQLLCESPCVINVDDHVRLEQSTRLAGVAPLDATAVQVNVEGGFIHRAAFRADQRSVVEGSVYAPEGLIRLGVNGRFRGAFVGKSIEVLQRAHVVSVPRP